MIYITIKVKNDHASYMERFEQETLYLDADHEILKDMIETTIKRFGQPVEEVVVKTTMDV